MTYLTDSRTGGTTVSDLIASLRTRMVEAAAARRVYRTTVRELDALSNRDLADLGLTRSMIKGIAYDAAYGAA